MLSIASARQLVLAESTLETQLLLLGAQAALWFWLVPAFAKRVGRPFLTSRTWFGQWSELTNKYFLALFGIALPRSTTDEIGFEWTGILFQHGVGALLCVPAMLGLMSPEARIALALHGSLCEAGWELQDGLCRLHAVTLGSPEKRALNPPAVLKFFATSWIKVCNPSAESGLGYARERVRGLCRTQACPARDLPPPRALDRVERHRGLRYAILRRNLAWVTHEREEASHAGGSTCISSALSRGRYDNR
jgi:hypothetical protein